MISLAQGITMIVCCITILWIGLFVDPTEGVWWNLKENWPPLLAMLFIAGIILGVGA